MDEIRHIINHLLGTCGDGHPSILALLGDSNLLDYIQQILKFKHK